VRSAEGVFGPVRDLSGVKETDEHAVPDGDNFGEPEKLGLPEDVSVEVDESVREGDVDDVRESLSDLELDTVGESEAAVVAVGGRGVPEPDEQPDSDGIADVVSEPEELADSDAVLLTVGDTVDDTVAETDTLEQAVTVGVAVPVAPPERVDVVEGDPVKVNSAEPVLTVETVTELEGDIVVDVDAVVVKMLVIV
jgi:hypothetical protein